MAFVSGVLFVTIVHVTIASGSVVSASVSTDGDIQSTPAPQIIHASPSNYLQLVRQLHSGDRLVLEPGLYDNPEDVPGLPVFNLHGTSQAPIVITGPDTGPRPVFRARATHNTIRIANSSYVVIRRLDLDGRNIDVAGVRTEGVSHHITLEQLVIRNHGATQQTVGISVLATAWDWVIRDNVIAGAGTGMYLGRPDGTAPFVGGLIEYNLITDTTGYNIQLKHQNARPSIAGMPTGDAVTVIRHNVLGKSRHGAKGGDARPNLLVGHFPLQGHGAEDVYLIYGNFFFQNDSGECLFQGEGNIALYNNLFFNEHGDAICIHPHNGVPRRVYVFFNTVLAKRTGVRVAGGNAGYPRRVEGNAIFADVPLQAANAGQNLTDSFSAADKYLIHPSGDPGMLDLSPRPGRLVGEAIDIRALDVFPDWSRDFDGHPRGPRQYGAYAGDKWRPTWLPRLELKPRVSTSVILQ